jgi:type I restriction enzyme, R subunit
MPGTNEAVSRVKIDAQLRDQGWDVLDINAVRFEYVLPDKTKADYVLCDRNGRALAVIEAKKAAINPAEAEAQARGYAQQLKAPYIFLANGEEIRFWEWQREAFPRPIKTFFSAARRDVSPCCIGCSEQS